MTNRTDDDLLSYVMGVLSGVYDAGFDGLPKNFEVFNSIANQVLDVTYNQYVNKLTEGNATGNINLIYNDNRTEMTKEKKVNIPYLILTYRKSLKLTQEQFGIKYDVSKPTIANWESGRRSVRQDVLEDAINHLYASDTPPFNVHQSIRNIINNHTTKDNSFADSSQIDSCVAEIVKFFV